MELISSDNPILLNISKKIETGYRLNNIVDDMFKIMYDNRGIGLASPQVGLSISLFIIDTNINDNLYPMKEVFINPTIKSSGEFVNFEEGCLSLPGLIKQIKRRSNVKISYYNLNWEHKEIDLDGINARVVQHEFDHLNGKLIIHY